MAQTSIVVAACQYCAFLPEVADTLHDVLSVGQLLSSSTPPLQLSLYYLSSSPECSIVITSSTLARYYHAMEDQHLYARLRDRRSRSDAVDPKQNDPTKKAIKLSHECTEWLQQGFEGDWLQEYHDLLETRIGRVLPHVPPPEGNFRLWLQAQERPGSVSLKDDLEGLQEKSTAQQSLEDFQFPPMAQVQEDEEQEEIVPQESAPVGTKGRPHKRPRRSSRNKTLDDPEWEDETAIRPARSSKAVSSQRKDSTIMGPSGPVREHPEKYHAPRKGSRKLGRPARDTWAPTDVVVAAASHRPAVNRGRKPKSKQILVSKPGRRIAPRTGIRKSTTNPPEDHGRDLLSEQQDEAQNDLKVGSSRRSHRHGGREQQDEPEEYVQEDSSGRRMQYSGKGKQKATD